MVPTLTLAFAVLAQMAAAQQVSRPSAKVQFVVPRGIKQAQVQPAPEATVKYQTPQILCTMPLLRPKGDVDPKIVVEPPKNGARIRSVEVPPCVERTQEPNRER